MSYILDALNKSEQESRNRKAPGLGTVHRAPDDGHRDRIPWIPTLAILVVVNTALAWYWFGDGSSGAGQPQQAPATAPAFPAPDTVSAEGAQSARRPAPQPASQVAMNADDGARLSPSAPGTSHTSERSSEAQPGVLITPDDLARATTTRRPAAADLLRVGELPMSVQQRLPDMRFSSHIYSDEPSFRMVNINGKTLREGDMVAGDVRLREITEDGVILNYLQYTFEVSVLSDFVK